ncbi:Gfo/Idh/MocA family oxidoreductase [Pseudophaeobacter sp.]|uniref:Gfo/Idh/MocA family oxidoreductase n=1 Tax=Pseudophaeobacter sp. TaxID=1971739 RepID=UPI0040598650
MTQPIHKKRKAVVCGSKFGRIYLAAFSQPGCPFELAGLVGQGSARTQICAETYGLPLYNDPEDVPDDIEIACVVVGSGPNGGHGAEIAQRFMERGIHVVQEHPLLPQELQSCFRVANAKSVVYLPNTHYVNLAPIQCFVGAAIQLAEAGQVSFVDASCSIQVAYALFDVLGQALGGVTPNAFAPKLEWPEAVTSRSAQSNTYESIAGVLAGVPFSLRVQNELNGEDPDNFSHHLMRITLGGKGGTLNLFDTHGPVVWNSRLHLPPSAHRLAVIGEAPEAYLDLPTHEPLWQDGSQSHRDVLTELWPQGVCNVLQQLEEKIVIQHAPLADAQYHLSVCKLWQQVTNSLGFPELRKDVPSDPRGAQELGLVPEGDLR